jgi:hypothetical protein
MHEVFSLGHYQLEVARDFGPRIVGLRRDGAQVLAVLGDDVALATPGRRPYLFRGGHRLWASPEIPEITYAPDDHPCDIAATGETLVVSAPPDDAGIAKRIEVSLDGTELVVEHTITGPPGTSVAAWGITQFPLGGTAVLSIAGGPTAPRPDRSLVLWPYTSMSDPRIGFEEGVVSIEAREGDQIKVGFGPGPRKMGYWRDGELFSKVVPAAPEVPDRGAVAQVYVGQGFCELEGVGTLTELGEGSATLLERWALVSCPDLVSARRIVAGGTG